MPTFPRSPYHSVRLVFPNTAGRLAFRWGLPGFHASLGLLPTFAARWPVCVHPSYTSWSNVIPHSVGSLTRSCTAIKWDYHFPRGPRSCSSYVVSSRHHLIEPIRPTHGHIAISPRGGLYAMSSLCGSAEATREWFRAFAAHSFLTMPSSSTPGSSNIHRFQPRMSTLAFTECRPARHSQDCRKSVSRGR